jgi:hypothetical protein
MRPPEVDRNPEERMRLLLDSSSWGDDDTSLRHGWLA